MPYFIETKRLGLRPLHEGDADGPYTDWLNNAETCSGNSHHVFPYTRSEAVDYIKAVAHDRSSLVLAIIMKSSDQHVGNISLQHIHPINRSAELALLIGEKGSRGQGIGDEACRAIVAHGIRSMNLRRIACGTYADNTAMQKLALSLGMREEGRRCQAAFKNGTWQDVIEFGLLSDDFKFLPEH